MKNKKFKNKIVYVIPPQCVTLLKQKSSTSKCHSIIELPKPSPEFIDSHIVNPNKSGISDWIFKPKSIRSKPESANDASTKTTVTPTQIQIQETKQPSSPLTLRNTLPSTTAISKSSKYTQPVSTYQPSTTETAKTVAPVTATSRSTSITSPRPIITEPVFTVFESLTKKSETVTPLTTTSRSTIEITPKPIVTEPFSTALTKKTKTEITVSTTTTGTTPTKTKVTRGTSKKCFEWYNKIKDATSSPQTSELRTTPSPQTSKPSDQSISNKCLKWYDLIKDFERNLCFKKSACWEKKSSIDCKTSVLNRIDRWLDQRTGLEYLEPIFPTADFTSEGNLTNPFIQFLAHQETSLPPKDVFDHAIQERLKTLKWLNQQINNQYRILTKIEKIDRTSRSVGNVSKIKISNRKTRVSGTSRSNRAQRFRDEFIKKKMQRLSIDKNDGWWKNFNAKMYDKYEVNDFSL